MPRPDRFRGKVAVITGGGSGFGREVGLMIAAEGGAVGVNDVLPERAKAVREEIEAAGGKALDVAGDVAKEADCERLVRETVKAFGRLDLLLTSAGIHGGGRDVVDTTVEIWEKVIGIDLTGAYLASKFALAEMRKAGGGSIVHISSIGGLRGHGGTAFSSAKGGLVNLTRHMAVTHAKENVRVNCVCPGVVRTPLTERWLSNPEQHRKADMWHPMGRIGKVEEVATAVCFLLSDEASFITGVILPVDGGYIAAGRDSLVRELG
jgi:NAD(P)-dependent dehydrogenase (short-subunit alcohol dehydrogenase family)